MVWTVRPVDCYARLGSSVACRDDAQEWVATDEEEDKATIAFFLKFSA